MGPEPSPVPPREPQAAREDPFRELKLACARGLRRLLDSHRGKTFGALAGFLLALSVMVLGFWWTLFVLALTAAGYWVGRRFDEEQGDLYEMLDRFLPPEHR